jgi:hypothetical protein
VGDFERNGGTPTTTRIAWWHFDAFWVECRSVLTLPVIPPKNRLFCHHDLLVGVLFSDVGLRFGGCFSPIQYSSAA